MCNKKIIDERKFLELAQDALTNIFGQFKIDESQTDKPDAAIILERDSKCIGIEITSVDRGKDLAYINEKKLTNEASNQQITDFIEKGAVTKNPMKSRSISFPKEYISSGIESKRTKFAGYSDNGSFDELIVLATSKFLDVDNSDFEDYLSVWANFLLSDTQYPFDKVIFVGCKSGKATLIYDAQNPLIEKPEIDPSRELGITEVKGSFVPIGQPFNINDMFDKKPVIESKSKSKKVQKERNKARRNE